MDPTHHPRKTAFLDPTYISIMTPLPTWYNNLSIYVLTQNLPSSFPLLLFFRARLYYYLYDHAHPLPYYLTHVCTTAESC